MKITNVEDQLKSYRLSELTKWMEYNWHLLPKYQDLIADKIRSIQIRITARDPNTCTSHNIETFYCTLMKSPKFDRSIYELLNIMTNQVIFPDYGKIPDIFTEVSMWTKIEMLALMDENKVKNQVYNCFEDSVIKVAYQFLMRIIDIYIPTHNPSLLVNAILNKTSFPEILKEAKSTNRIMERFKDCSEEVNIKEIVLLHKIFANIYQNPEASYDFMEKYHQLLNTKFFLRNEVAGMITKYNKYLDETESATEVFFYSIFSLFGHGNTTLGLESVELRDQIEGFLQEFSFQYRRKVSAPVLKVILMDIAKIVKSHDCYHSRDDAIRFIMEELLKGWESPKYNIPFDITEECVLLPTDTPISTLEEIDRLVDLDVVTEAKKELSAKMNTAEKKIYKAYRTYKENEEKVDSQITKAVTGLKGVLTGDVREEIIEGKKFSAIGLLKKLLGGVALFSFSKILGAITLVTHFALKKKTTDSERSKILMEIDTEIAMLEEKINDARADQNRDAKYAMMRTKKELENAKARIEYGMSADQGSLSNTKKTLDESRKVRGVA